MTIHDRLHMMRRRMRFVARAEANAHARSRRKLLNELDARTMLRDLGASPEHKAIGNLLLAGTQPDDALIEATARAMEKDGVLPSAPAAAGTTYPVLRFVDGGEGGVP